ncbi:MAG: SMC family ATPase [Anaerolineae bacterium]
MLVESLVWSDHACDNRRILLAQEATETMIPVRLEMKNFLPYRSPDPVRFDGIHLACLTGPNGAGKSSLLDAVTWALWGRARARRDEDLVHLGQADMHVQFDFRQEDTVYRVFRRRARGKRGMATLDLFVIREDDTPNLITEPSMKATQNRINELLRLDYDTFVHSAFLQQGKADAFTTRTPAERKKILSDILGLDRWAIYEERTKEILRGITERLRVYEITLQEIAQELAKRPQLNRELAEASIAYSEAQTALAAAEARERELAHVPGALQNADMNQKDRARRLREHQADMESVRATIARHQEQIKHYQEVITTREDIESGYAALQAARTANQSLSDKLLQLKGLDDERYTLQSQVDTARASLESDIRAQRQRLTELEQAATDRYATELEKVQAEVSALETREAERMVLDTQINDWREQRANLDGQLKSVTAEGQALRDRLARLQATDPEAATCPLCGQPLDATNRGLLIAQLEDEIESKREEYRQSTEEAANLVEQVKTGRSQLGEMDIELKRLPPLRERVGVLQTQMQTAQQAAERLIEAREALAALEAQLMAEAFAEAVREQLAALDARQAELGYDQGSHDDARQQLDSYRRYEELHTQLKIALEGLASAQENLTDAEARCERLEKAAQETQAEIDTLESEIAKLRLLEQEHLVREAEVQQQRTLERTAHGRVVSAEQALKSLDAQMERKEQLEERRAAALEKEALYGELQRAFSKKGIPAMIIETAIPELEISANDLLARMTDGRMHLRLTTQREKVSGGITETLDIEIADELGTRSYEMYSGGEAFRINFALRVALSQMLARRAGAHLRTLFIDEGFGTQDENGRTKLVEAINAIQEEFDLILVITHIDELRDSFPVHIVVDKTPNGSRIGIR